MKVVETDLPGCLLLEPRVFSDEHGFFYESFNADKLAEIGKSVRILEEGLKGGLNPAQGGEIARNLGALYDYCIGRLTLANLRNDVALLEEVVHLIAPVAQSWNEIGANNGAPAQGAGA